MRIPCIVTKENLDSQLTHLSAYKLSRQKGNTTKDFKPFKPELSPSHLLHRVVWGEVDG